MTQIRFAGFQTGSDLGTVTATVGGASRSAVVPSYRKPLPPDNLPRVRNGQFDDEILSVDTTGLTGITGYIWRSVGGATQSTTATLNGAGLGNTWVECEVTCDQGVLVTPAILIYATSMMGTAMPAGHIADDKAVLALVPHDEATHIAVADGVWTDPAIWNTGSVPMNGAFALIPHGRTVTYDNMTPNIRLDRIRIDGVLQQALDRSTTMLVETEVTTRGGSRIIGSPGNRLPAQYSAETIISGKDYSAASYTPTDLKADNFLTTKGWGRGILNQGTSRIWGKRQTTWEFADAEVSQGATSLTLKKAPVGLAPGDEICIGATTSGYVNGGLMGQQDEYRILTDVSGATLSWATPLDYPHHNQLPGSTRTDLYPVVMVRAGKNITFRSEVTAPSWRRGHRVSMHMHCTVDEWDFNALDLGRTDKKISAGIIDENNDFKCNKDRVTLSGPLTVQSNLMSRYSSHVHHAGFLHSEEETPIISNAYVEGVPGWGIVHHACACKIRNCAVHKFWGGGIVSESANEVDLWNDNLVLQTTYDETISQDGYGMYEAYKNLETTIGRAGDNFRHGVGFGFRGRAMRTNRNVAVSCGVGYLFFHRANFSTEDLVTPINLKRANIDLKEVGLVNQGGMPSEDFSFVDYPIMHMVDNTAIACVQGGTVIKQSPKQFHDTHIRFDRFQAWGIRDQGFAIEYVDKYILNDFDLLGGADAATYAARGIVLDTNAFQIGVVRPRIEGFGVAIRTNGAGDTADVNDLHDQDNPRFFHIGVDGVDNGLLIDATMKVDDVKTAEDITFGQRDWDGTLLDYDADPTTNLPLILAQSDGAGAYGTPDNTWGVKSDNLSDNGFIIFAHHEDHIVPLVEGNVTNYAFRNGYHTYDGKNVLVFPDIIGDRLTARPFKRTNMIERIGYIDEFTNNGPFVYSPVPVVQADKIVTVPENGSITVDMISGATGGGGPGTYALDLGDHIAPNHGTVELDGVTGEITYTADEDYMGTDLMYFFVESQGQYATVRITVLIGQGGPVTTPVLATHFSATDHPEANTIGVRLIAQPPCGGRFIETVQYSTDGGATWRRLCNRWVHAVHKVTVESDGSPLGAGNTNIRLRYKTDYDNSTSGASADALVTVS